MYRQLHSDAMRPQTRLIGVLNPVAILRRFMNYKVLGGYRKMIRNAVSKKADQSRLFRWGSMSVRFDNRLSLFRDDIANQ